MRTLRRRLVVGTAVASVALSVFGGVTPQPAQAMTCESNLPLGEETCDVFLTVVGTACRAASKYCQLG
ncbi:MAG TPA: hypothetical protein VNB24_10525 [Acidimicrobiales bacterium]|nr:hypothetical protein [Acidimicrobiales bacterium]